MNLSYQLASALHTAATNAEEKIAAIANEIQQSETREALRALKEVICDGSVAPAPDLSKSPLTNAFVASLDTLSEQSQQFQLGLQRLLSDISQAAAMTSNVMKKLDDANNAVIGNIKG